MAKSGYVKLQTDSGKEDSYHELKQVEEDDDESKQPRISSLTSESSVRCSDQLPSISLHQVCEHASLMHVLWCTFPNYTSAV